MWSGPQRYPISLRKTVK